MSIEGQKKKSEEAVIAMDSETLAKVADEQARRHEEARKHRQQEINQVNVSHRREVIEIPPDHWEDFSTPIVVSGPKISEELRDAFPPNTSNPFLRAVVTAKVVGGMDLHDSLPLLAAEKAEAEARKARFVREKKEEEAKSEMSCADGAAKVQYVVGITATQKRLMSDDAEYRKDMETELRAEQKLRAFKAEMKLRHVEREAAGASLDLAEISAAERAGREKRAFAHAIRELTALSDMEDELDVKRLERAKCAAEMEREKALRIAELAQFDARIARSEKVIAEARTLRQQQQ